MHEEIFSLFDKDENEILDWLNLEIGRRVPSQTDHTEERVWSSRVTRSENRIPAPGTHLYVIGFSKYQDLILFKMRWT